MGLARFSGSIFQCRSNKKDRYRTYSALKDRDLRVRPMISSKKELTAIFPKDIVTRNREIVSHENNKNFWNWPLSSTTWTWFPMPACEPKIDTIKVAVVHISKMSARRKKTRGLACRLSFTRFISSGRGDYLPTCSRPKQAVLHHKV